MKGNHFAGTGKLLKLYLRRDRIILPVWILLALLVIYGQVSFVKAMSDWQVYITELSESPLTSALLGPVVPLSMEGAILWRKPAGGLIDCCVFDGDRLRRERFPIDRTDSCRFRMYLCRGRRIMRAGFCP